MPTITTSDQCCTRGLRKYKKTRKIDNKSQKNWKERNKTVLFTDDLIIHIENLKESTDKLVILISEFNKVTGTRSLYKS